MEIKEGVYMEKIKGLENMKETINKVAEGGANAILLHKGIEGVGHRGKGKDVGILLCKIYKKSINSHICSSPTIYQ